MTILELIELLVQFITSPVVKDHAAAAVVVILIVLWLIEASSLKARPIHWIVSWIGRAINSETNAAIEKMHQDTKESINNLKTEVSKIKEDASKQRHLQELRDVKNARARILRVSDEITNGVKHGTEFLGDTIKEDITTYENYCKVHEDPEDPYYFENGRCPNAIQKIRDEYAKVEKESRRKS